MFKIPSQQLRATLTAAFERLLLIEDFTNMDHHRCQACTKTFDLLLLCFSFSQIKFTATKCYYINIFHETFIPVNGKNY